MAKSLFTYLYFTSSYTIHIAHPGDFVILAIIKVNNIESFNRIGRWLPEIKLGACG